MLITSEQIQSAYDLAIIRWQNPFPGFASGFDKRTSDNALLVQFYWGLTHAAKHEWLKTFLELPNGIASHDTFGRMFAALDPEQFQACLLGWIRAVSEITQGQVVAIDGKSP